MKESRGEIKYSIQQLLGVGFTMVVLGIGLTYGIEVLSDVGEDFCSGGLLHEHDSVCLQCPNSTYNNYFSVDQTCGNYTGSYVGSTQTINVTPTKTGSYEFNATANANSGIVKFPEKLETIATVIVASVILGILVTYIWARFAR